jgi:4'-phosphopantetheinyl transferase
MADAMLCGIQPLRGRAARGSRWLRVADTIRTGHMEDESTYIRVNAMPAGRVDVWFTLPRACSSANLEAYRLLLSAPERRSLEQRATDALQREYLLTRALCRLTLARYAPVHPTEWTFYTSHYGRPEIFAPALDTPLRFNLSNTSTFIACAVARDVDVGIDVERLDREVDAVALASSYFSLAEQAGLKELAPSARDRRFFELWTLKEAYVKARGTGLSTPVEQTSFDVLPSEVRARFERTLADTPTEWQFWQREVAQHVVSVAVRKGQEPLYSVELRQTHLPTDE